jgi:hypothetical protein
VAVGQVMNDLTDRPAAFAIRRIDASRGQRCQGPIQIGRQIGDNGDELTAALGRSGVTVPSNVNVPTGYRGSIRASSAPAAGHRKRLPIIHSMNRICLQPFARPDASKQAGESR